MNDLLKIAVMSDLHCKHGGGNSVSDTQTFLTTDLDLKPINRHPIEAIKKTINDEKIEADILVCPGDISDRIDKAGLFTGWKFVQEVGQELGAKKIIATVGNHDVDSRKKYENPHSFDLVKQLSDKGYPTFDTSLNTYYWANDFCVVQDSNIVIVNFNSCCSHTDEKGALNCVIKRDTVDQIEAELSSINDLKGKFKIFLLHHHPIHHSNFDLRFRDSDFVQNGDYLLEVLEKFYFDIVIHGHKHEPKLRVVGKLPVFSSGSFSSMMNIIDIGAQNTFHLITMDNVNKTGTVDTWGYGPVSGWSRKGSTFFPSVTGYGAKRSVEDIADLCDELYNGSHNQFIKFDELSKQIPDIKHLLPIDQIKLNDILLSKYKLKIFPSLYDMEKILIKSHN